MKYIFKHLILVTFLICSGPLFALSLQEAKEQGLVGEQPNGYLGTVGFATSEVIELVNDINAKRKDAYEGIARKNNTPLETIEKLAGQKAIQKTPAGQIVKDMEGNWVKLK